MAPTFIPRLQPITDESLFRPVAEQVAAFCEGGAEWVQLRLKTISDDEFLKLGQEVRELTRSMGVRLILDDRVHLVRELEADGVHLGEKDMPVAQARELLGPDALIGGTADRSERIQELHAEGVDYIGCGPFRYTSTKKDLSPILGLDGYQKILRSMGEAGIRLPLLAIGGVRRSDIPSLLATGVHGIAVSSSIAGADDPVAEMKEFLSVLYDEYPSENDERSGAGNG